MQPCWPSQVTLFPQIIARMRQRRVSLKDSVHNRALNAAFFQLFTPHSRVSVGLTVAHGVETESNAAK